MLSLGVIYEVTPSHEKYWGGSKIETSHKKKMSSLHSLSLYNIFNVAGVCLYFENYLFFLTYINFVATKYV